MLTLALPDVSSRESSVTGDVVRHTRAARRVRIAFDGLLGDPELARRIEAALAARTGVALVSADPASGRVLICYREGAEPSLTGALDFAVPATPPQASPLDRTDSETVSRAGLALLARAHDLAGRTVDAVRARAVDAIDSVLRAVPGMRPRPSPAAGFAAAARPAEFTLGPSEGPKPPAKGLRWAKPSYAPRESARAWHAMTREQVLEQLATGKHGLGEGEAAVRIVRYGANAVETEAGRSGLQIAAAQFANLPTVLLIGSAGASLLLGDFIDAGAILVVVGANAAIGYRIERKNEELLASWRKLEAGEVQVLRDEAVRSVPATALVPGDVFLLREGSIVPADARVLDAHRLACDEAALTGESEAQGKTPDPVAAGAPLAERTSLVYAGTNVVSGRGRAVVVATGPDTEVAAVRRLVAQTGEAEAPLQRRLDELGRRATFAGLAAAGIVFAGGLLRGHPLALALRSAVALGVAAIPEGMPVVATAALVRTMTRMRRNGMVVRRVVSAETLGGVTVVCMDKTGTITENEMRLEVLDVGGRRLRAAELRARPEGVLEDEVTLALAAGILNSDIEYHHSNGNGLELAGSSTERALVEGAQRAGLDPDDLRRRYPRLLLQERHNGLHYVVSVHDGPTGRFAIVKGAPEQVLPLCGGEASGPLEEEGRTSWLRRNEELAAGGHRVLALAWTPLASGQTWPNGDAANRVGERELGSREPFAGGSEPSQGSAGTRPMFHLLGLVGLRDPLRPGAADAIATAARAGIRTLILTGDQRATAAAIARELGLEGQAIDGAELAARLEAGDPGARAELARAAVLSRVSPGHKVAIVKALRAAGEIVAMAGDGINDAPALKAADVGIAVGAHASDVARQTADVVLENADLRSILAAVGEGRIVQDNLRRSIRFLFASNLSEIVVSLAGLAIGRDLLTSRQLLWINLLTDTLPALALALEPGDPNVLARKPAAPGSPLLGQADWGRVVRDGVGLAALGGAGFLVGGPLGGFATLTAGQLGYAFACRSEETRIDGRSMRLLGAAVGLQAASTLLPPLRAALQLPGGALPLAGLAVGLAVPPLVRSASRLLTRSNGPLLLPVPATTTTSRKD